VAGDCERLGGGGRVPLGSVSIVGCWDGALRWLEHCRKLAGGRRVHFNGRSILDGWGDKEGCIWLAGTWYNAGKVTH
jgi:hypothetical protein